MEPYLHFFFYRGAEKSLGIWDKLSLYYVKFNIINKTIDAGSEPSEGAIQEEFSEQHQHPSN